MFYTAMAECWGAGDDAREATDLEQALAGRNYRNVSYVHGAKLVKPWPQPDARAVIVAKGAGWVVTREVLLSCVNGYNQLDGAKLVTAYAAYRTDTGRRITTQGLKCNAVAVAEADRRY